MATKYSADQERDFHGRFGGGGTITGTTPKPGDHVHIADGTYTNVGTGTSEQVGGGEAQPHGLVQATNPDTALVAVPNYGTYEIPHEHLTVVTHPIKELVTVTTTPPVDQMEHKSVGVSGFKILDEDEGIVETVVSVTGVIDRVKDDILPGAYEKTLNVRTPKGVWSHDWEIPIAKTLEATELHPGDPRLPSKIAEAGGGGLLIRTQFNLNTQRGSEAFSDVKFYGEDQEWSVGYKVPLGKSTVDKKTGVRSIEEMDLYEYSPVLFGAMPLANTVSVKELAEAVTHEMEEKGKLPPQFAKKPGDDAKPGDKKPGAKPGADDIGPHKFTDDGKGKCKTCGLTEQKCAAMYKPEEKGSVPADTYGEPGFDGQSRQIGRSIPSVEARAPAPDGQGTDLGGPSADTGDGEHGPGGKPAQESVRGIPSVESRAPAPDGQGQDRGDAPGQDTGDGEPGYPTEGKPTTSGIPSVLPQAPSPSGDGENADEPTQDAQHTPHEYVADAEDGNCEVCGQGQNAWIHTGFVHGPAGDAPVSSATRAKADAFFASLNEESQAALAETIKADAVHTTHKFQGKPNGPCSVCGKRANTDLHSAYSTADPNPQGGAKSVLDSAYALWDAVDTETKVGRVLSGSNVSKVKAAISALQEVLTLAGAGDEAKIDPEPDPDPESKVVNIAPGVTIDGSITIPESELMEFATVRYAS